MDVDGHDASLSFADGCMDVCLYVYKQVGAYLVCMYADMRKMGKWWNS